MKKINYARRGMNLEKKIDAANKAYLKGFGFTKNHYASIKKIPTPVQITKDNGKFITGFKKRGELVDYLGVLLPGHAIAFDAKETKGKSLPLSNIHESQYKFLSEWHYLGSTSFIIVYFSEEDKYFIIKFKQLREAFERSESGGRKSISIDECENEVFIVNGILNYLEGI